VSRPGNLSIKSGDGLHPDPKTSKPAFTVPNELCLEEHSGLEIAKAGFVDLAEFVSRSAS
jgi:hypothetical protein